MATPINASNDAPVPPPLPPGRVVLLPGRGEIFARISDEPASSDAPLPVLLLHGWTASADTNWFPLFDSLEGHRRLVAPDHRGHGRGMRPEVPFSLEDCADDAAELVRSLGIERVIVCGYSMGGPVSMLLWQRHRSMVAGLVLGATALEWRASLRERFVWRFMSLLELGLRLGSGDRAVRRILASEVKANPELAPLRAWLIGETRRSSPSDVAAAGRALSRYDARGFASGVDVPTAVVLTTKDRLVRPKKQRQLAAATRARVFPVDGDHDLPLVKPKDFALVFRQAIDEVSVEKGE